jgi:predicted secreted acid phosphatase
MYKIKAIICDLDGTYFDTTHRQSFMQGKKKDWKNFNANIPGDSVHEWCRELVFAMFFRGFHIIFCSGREDSYKDVTMEGLIDKMGLENMQMVRPSLFMRKAKDHRQDYIVKTEIYKTYIEPKYDVLFCIDDRQQVVDGWRALGLTCLQCAPGNF